MKKNIRSCVFWALDKLRGSPVRKHYEDIEQLFNSYGTVEGHKALNAKLGTILQHAVTTVPFYKNINPEEGIASFPVVNKNIIKEQFKKFRSDSYSSEKTLFPVITSGSTGTPFKIFQDVEKRRSKYC